MAQEAHPPARSDRKIVRSQIKKESDGLTKVAGRGTLDSGTENSGPQPERTMAAKLHLTIAKKGNGYMVTDPRTNSVITGSHPFPYSLSASQVEQWLKDERTVKQRTSS
jgi:hypothetical protein